MNGYLVILGLLHLTACVFAQQYGPVPARPQQFAGATLIQPARPNLRQRFGAPRAVPELIPTVDQVPRRAQPARKVKPQFVQPQIVDQQRNNFIDDSASPTPLPQFQSQTPKLTPRPVEEEVNEEEEIPTTIVTTPTTTAYTPAIRSSYPAAPVPAPSPGALQPNLSPTPFQRPQFVQPSAFRPAVPQPLQPAQFAAPPQQGRQLVRQQARPVQGVQVPTGRQIFPQAIPSSPILEEDPFFRQIQNRPLKKQEPARQQVVDREPLRQQQVRLPEAARQQPASRTQNEFVASPQKAPHAKAPQRERKPVAQTIRKYHEEHEDGSITWGYENDDGSFKEETIGVDCVTRGKYGYYDPDGVKREYTYQTGIPCEKAQESEEAASDQGFVDYTNNKYVLPNGDEIDLEAMVKNRARKPVSRFSKGASN